MPKLSIIMPVYNAEKYLQKSIEGILAQSLRDFELILVNDGSTDISSAICHKYEKQNHRIKVIDKENGGAGSARNAGIRAAEGEYLAFPDADDFIELDIYTRMLSAAGEKDLDLIFCGYEQLDFDDDDRIIATNTYHYEPIFCETAEECRSSFMKLVPTSTLFDSPCNKLYSKRVISENGIFFPDIRRGQDAFFNLEFYSHITCFKAIPDILYHYRANNQSRVWTKFPKDYYSVVELYHSKLVSILSEWTLMDEKNKQFSDSYLVAGAWIACAQCMNPKWNMNRHDKTAHVAGIINRDYFKTHFNDLLVRPELVRKAVLIRKGDSAAIVRTLELEAGETAMRKWLSTHKTLYAFLRKVKHAVS